MTTTPNDTQALITRLDACLQRVESPEGQSQGLVYAAFLTDVQKSRIDASSAPVQEAMSVIGGFATSLTSPSLSRDTATIFCPFPIEAHHV